MGRDHPEVSRAGEGLLDDRRVRADRVRVFDVQLRVFGPGEFEGRLAQSVLYSSAEKVEGTTAFLEKRTPDYRAAQRKDDDA